MLQGLSLENNLLNCSMSDVLQPFLDRELQCWVSTEESVFPRYVRRNCRGLSELLVGQNDLFGSIPGSLIYLRSLSLLDVHDNNLTGTLPHLVQNFSFVSPRSHAAPAFTSRLGVDALRALSPQEPLSSFGTSLAPMSLVVFRAHLNPGLIGSIPDSYGRLPYLSTLSVFGTAMRAPTSSALLPKFLTFSNSLSIKVKDAHLSCQAIVGSFRNITVEVSGEYFGWSHCSCQPGYFGVEGKCVKCPDACPCRDNRVTGCFPSTYGADTAAMAASAETVVAVLPCPRFGMSLTSATACNPDNEAGFSCAEGHDDSFMCATCKDGYFVTGYACAKCTGLERYVLPALYVRLC